MDTRLLARVGAAVFVGIAIAMTLVQLREEPVDRPVSGREVWLPEGDRLPGQLRACADMGEQALSDPACRAAWAEKRRRFFGVDHPAAYAGLEPVPETREISSAPTPVLVED